eukprot:1595133-Amphidinium_carterae.3
MSSLIARHAYMTRSCGSPAASGDSVQKDCASPLLRPTFRVGSDSIDKASLEQTQEAVDDGAANEVAQQRALTPKMFKSAAAKLRVWRALATRCGTIQTKPTLSTFKQVRKQSHIEAGHTWNEAMQLACRKCHRAARRGMGREHNVCTRIKLTTVLLMSRWMMRQQEGIPLHDALRCQLATRLALRKSTAGIEDAGVDRTLTCKCSVVGQ